MFPKATVLVLSATLPKLCSNLCELLIKCGMWLLPGWERTRSPPETGCGSGVDRLCKPAVLRFLGLLGKKPGL